MDLRRGAFRRTYSSNSIKKKSIEVTPSSFVKIRLLGKGDVGKVYLVRQKDTDRLYAMKGKDRQADYPSFVFAISVVECHGAIAWLNGSRGYFVLNAKLRC